MFNLVFIRIIMFRTIARSHGMGSVSASYFVVRDRFFVHIEGLQPISLDEMNVYFVFGFINNSINLYLLIFVFHILFINYVFLYIFFLCAIYSPPVYVNIEVCMCISVVCFLYICK